MLYMYPYEYMYMEFLYVERPTYLVYSFWYFGIKKDFLY